MEKDGELCEACRRPESACARVGGCCGDCTHTFGEGDDADPAGVDDAAVERFIVGDEVALTSDEVLTVVNRLRKEGWNDERIGQRFGVSASGVYYWRTGRARPQPRNAGGQPQPAPRTSGRQPSLLERGLNHPQPRVVAAARRAQEAIERLRTLVTEEDAKQEARDRVAALERELAEARAALSGGAVLTCRASCDRPFSNEGARRSHEKRCGVSAAA